MRVSVGARFHSRLAQQLRMGGDGVHTDIYAYATIILVRFTYYKLIL